MANRSKGGRRRSRKRSSSGSAPSSTPGSGQAGIRAAAVGQASSKPPKRAERAALAQGPAAKGQPDAAGSNRGYRAPGSVGERPRPPWHPFPLAELMILVGLVAVAIGAARREAGKTLLLLGIVIVVLGTLETTIREHLSGYRSHAGLLAAVPTALLHGGVALALYALGSPRATWVLVPIALDVPVFWVLLKLLRARFQDARRERVFAGRR